MAACRMPGALPCWRYCHVGPTRSRSLAPTPTTSTTNYNLYSDSNCLLLQLAPLPSSFLPPFRCTAPTRPLPCAVANLLLPASVSCLTMAYLDDIDHVDLAVPCLCQSINYSKANTMTRDDDVGPSNRCQLRPAHGEYIGQARMTHERLHSDN